MSLYEERAHVQDSPSMGCLHVAAQTCGPAALLRSLIANVGTSLGNRSLRCSTSCMAQASLSTGSRSHLLLAVVCQEGLNL